MCTLFFTVLLFPNEFHLPLNSYIVWLPFQKFSLTWAFNYVFQVTALVGIGSFIAAYLCVTLILMNHTCWIIESAKLRLTNLNSYLEENGIFDDDDDFYEETQLVHFDEDCDAVEMLADVVIEKNHGELPVSLSAIIDDLLCDEIYREPTVSTWQEENLSRYTIDQDGPSTSGYQRPLDQDLPSTSGYERPFDQDGPSTSGYQRQNQSKFNPDSDDSDDSIDTIYLSPNIGPSGGKHMRVNNAERQVLPALANDEDFKELMKDVVIMICELMEWKNNLNSVLRFNFMVELSMISVIFAMCTFAINSNSSSLIVNACFITLVAFAEFFCYCLMGTRVSSHIDELSAEIYNVKWYLMTPKQRMDILILLPVTQKMKTF